MEHLIGALEESQNVITGAGFFDIPLILPSPNPNHVYSLIQTKNVLCPLQAAASTGL